MLLLIWELLYLINVDYLGIWKPYCFPPPLAVAEKIWQLATDGILLIAVMQSMKRMVIGFGISLCLGVVIGLSILKAKDMEKSLVSLLMGLQTLPSICWLPFAVLWFGLNDQAIIFVVVIGSTFSMALTVESAIKNVSPVYIKAAKMLGAKGLPMYISFYIPVTLPAIVAGMKQAWSFSWRALMAGEMLVSAVGLGQVLIMGRELADISQVVASMVVIVAIGLLVNRLVFEKIEYGIRRKWGTLINDGE